MIKPILIFSFLAAFPCIHPIACLWDYDTLAMERQRFPLAQELIAGHFLRHSEAYYRWRIADRTAKMAGELTAADLDDIAVAYDKLGQHEEAIATILRKIERWPQERRYESEANLGTFLIHAGRLEEGLQHIENALRINPNAHFGRERYQKLLVEYMLTKRSAGKMLPLGRSLYGYDGFASFLLNEQPERPFWRQARQAEISAAVKGVLGMMRFGQHDSPVLLEVLGDLLVADDTDRDAKMLAARAYLRASYEVEDSAAALAFREKAQQAISMQFSRELLEIEADLKSEIAQANALAKQIVADEQRWSELGKNVDAEFAAKYYDSPNLLTNGLHKRPMRLETRIILAVFGISALVMGAAFAIRRYRAKVRSANEG